jgi:hypothetical protein
MFRIGDKVKVKWNHEVDGKCARRYTVEKENGWVFLNRKDGSAFNGEHRNIESLEDEVYRMLDNDSIIWVKVGDV